MKFLGLALILIASIGAQAANPKISNLALKNYRELSTALSNATGVDPTTQEVQDYYNQVVAQLPRTGTLGEFNAQSLIASVGLASTYCKRVISQDALLDGHKSGLNTGIDFSKPASSATDMQVASLIKAYGRAFLQRDPTDLEKTTLAGMFKTQGSIDKTTQGTRDAILVVCTAVASSFEFLSN